MLLQLVKKINKFTNMVYVNSKYFLSQIKHPREIFLAGMLVCVVQIKVNILLNSPVKANKHNPKYKNSS
ncbi:Uncharacterised protein [Chlamydia trachomatis]|nr:Uncharacterised protein [Chlamydia trachomatis]